jgi:hypothetical protein
MQSVQYPIDSGRPIVRSRFKSGKLQLVLLSGTLVEFKTGKLSASEFTALLYEWLFDTNDDLLECVSPKRWLLGSIPI